MRFELHESCDGCKALREGVCVLGITMSGNVPAEKCSKPDTEKNLAILMMVGGIL